jgi:hypothetical protein
MSVTVYGSSDDLIEIEGDITEEFEAHDGEGDFLVFSDGTVLSIVYADPGIWRINNAVKGNKKYEKVEATNADDDYSDKVTIPDNIAWVVCGRMAVKGK